MNKDAKLIAEAYKTVTAQPVRKKEPDGTVHWKLNGDFHREDGPAIEWADGSKHWYLNDELHREDGPAIEWAEGSKYWYQNNELHREDGPAIEWPHGGKEWWLNGTEYTEKEFKEQAFAWHTSKLNPREYSVIP